MKHATWILGALALLLGGVGQARAEFIITFSQVGDNVEADGSGSIDTTALTGPFGVSSVDPPRVNANQGVVALGPSPAPSQLDLFVGFSGPASFGSGTEYDASTSSGPRISIEGAAGGLFLPAGYVSGTSLSDSNTWDNTTISGLGLTTGTYTWTWGTGANADSLEVIIPSASATPEPASLTLLGIGALCSLGYGWRRRRQSA
ncbi:MAG TPA: PEP-CTERM sorting domain-containing protein [Gemmataceae bacterium]|nr:PEP-CTERM sorting domain-containing protein [Gemmataceae bacterium]